MWTTNLKGIYRSWNRKTHNTLINYWLVSCLLLLGSILAFISEALFCTRQNWSFIFIEAFFVFLNTWVNLWTVCLLLFCFYVSVVFNARNPEQMSASGSKFSSFYFCTPPNHISTFRPKVSNSLVSSRVDQSCHLLLLKWERLWLYSI